MAVSINETEARYDAPAGAALPELGDLPQVMATVRPDAERLDAEYYDTGDLRLLRAGITLRQRRGGDDAGWHLKVPLSGGTRREIRLPPGQYGWRVPGELAGLVRVHTRGEPLLPVARLTTTRQRQILLGKAGQSLAELAADDVAAQTLRGTMTTSRWHEVELELTGGSRQLLKAADELLRRNGLRPSGHTAKLERALGSQLPEPVRQPSPTSSSPAGAVVLAYLRRHTDSLKSLDPMVRRDEADSVHQMRVASRRLRSTLRSFYYILHTPDTQPLADELKWLGTLLGRARDGEVLAAHIEAALRKIPAGLVIGPVGSRVQGHFAPMRAAARAGLLAALDSERYLSLLDELDRVLDSPPFTAQAAKPAADVLPRAVRRARRKAARWMRQARRAAPGQSRDVALHQARKAARRARYASEAMVPVMGAKAGRFASQMKKVQSVLGEHRDTVIARQAERELGISAHLAGENVFSYGLLYERGACAGARLQARAQRTWKRASRPRHLRWMR